MAHRDSFEVTVALAEPDRQITVSLRVSRGVTAEDAVERSGLLAGRGELDRSRLALAIYGRLVEGAQELEPGDRVEVLRPLRQDPRARRRQLARAGGGRRRGSARRG